MIDFSTSLSMSESARPILNPISATSVNALHSSYGSSFDSVRHFLRANRDSHKDCLWFLWFGGWSNSDGKDNRRAESGKGTNSIAEIDKDEVRCRLDGLGLSSIANCSSQQARQWYSHAYVTWRVLSVTQWTLMNPWRAKYYFGDSRQIQGHGNSMIKARPNFFVFC